MKLMRALFFFSFFFFFLFYSVTAKNTSVLFFLYLFAGRQFVASIEIDADFTDADYDLQSQRMTDLEEEVCSLLFYL